MNTLFSNETLPLDVALIMVTLPDELGYCSLGGSIDITLSAALAAKHIVAQVNHNMPRTNGQCFLHVNQFSVMIDGDAPLPTIAVPTSDPIHQRIGQYVSLLIEDRSTLQVGIGRVPDAVLTALSNHRDLGIHSEMMSDGVVDLIKKGVITNRYKQFHPRKSVTSFCIGTQAVYDFIHENPHVEIYPSSYVNNPANIAQNNNMTSINSALEVDLSGQVVADSIGYDFYSGIGGQMYFVTGATISKGGKSIIALPSTAKDKQISRIQATLAQGSGVVTSRGHVDYIVTEFGIASLKGKSIRERALELIRVAHPKFRAMLLEQVRQHYWVPDYQALTPTEVPKHMSRQKSCDLVSIDQSVDLALCVVKQNGSRVSIHAVGRFYYYAQNNTAEVAFVTRESSQGMGMASLLLNSMIDIARKRKFTGLFALVKSQNKPMINVFKQHGFIAQPSEDLHEKDMYLALEQE